MKINPGIFKKYDIRGVYNEDFNDETAYKIGLAYSEFIKKEIEEEKIEIVVASDMRLSSPSLKKKLINGLTDGGVDVIDIGLASTPTFYFSVAHYNYDGGVLVSASHNPAKYNGFKLVRKNGVPISGDTGIMDLRDMVINSPQKPEVAKGKIVEKEDVLKEEIQHALKYVDKDKIKKFKIVIDPANAMASLYFDELFKYLDCEIIKINWDLDGTFPAHEADPLKDENNEQIQKKIIEEKADLGITTDGDGDRIFFIDNKGKTVEGGATRAILSKLFLEIKPKSKIAYDARPGKISEDTIKEHGGTPTVTQVGHSLIKEQMLKEDVYFAGESSGHFYVNMGNDGCFEAPTIMTLLFLNELSKQGVSLSEYVKKYEKYFHSGEINSKVDDPALVIEKLKETYKDGKQTYLDGITIEYEDFWFNVRGSNTEPLLRLNLEAVDEGTMKKKRDEVLSIIRSS